MSVVESTGTDLEVVDHRTLVHVAPDVTAAELVKRIAVIEEAMKTAMKQDVDYGIIPGTGTKPTLLKPGAEKLGALFQLDVQLENQKIWHDDGHLTVVCRATVYHQPTGTRLGSGEGICTTREAKYAFRNEARKCPACGAEAIIKGKEEYGGGWLCWKNHKTIAGCGEKFRDGDPAIEAQAVGKVANENIADTYNTVDKMASKRARIDAVLAVTGASALFTQDIEDFAPTAPEQSVEPVITSTATRTTAPQPEVDIPALLTLVEEKGGDVAGFMAAMETAKADEAKYPAWLEFQRKHWEKQPKPFRAPVGVQGALTEDAA